MRELLIKYWKKIKALPKTSKIFFEVITIFFVVSATFFILEQYQKVKQPIGKNVYAVELPPGITKNDLNNLNQKQKDKLNNKIAQLLNHKANQLTIQSIATIQPVAVILTENNQPILPTSPSPTSIPPSSILPTSEPSPTLILTSTPMPTATPAGIKNYSSSSNSFNKSDLIKKPEKVKKTMATIIPEKEADFVKDGNLRLLEENEEIQRWRLLYGEPGNPAAMVFLDFNNRSKCDFGAGEQICNEKKFENGQRAHVEGNRNGDQLIVLKLKILSEE